MELAKVSQNGQITVPAEVRRELGIGAGDKILFYKNADGAMVMENASIAAIREAQAAFVGVAEELGVRNEDDVQGLVDEMRHGKK